MLLSSGYMSGDRVELTSSKSAKHIGAVFINKLQIWVLNGYILSWNTCVQWRQALAVAVRHVWYSAIEKKQSNLGVRSQAFRSLSSLQRWEADLIFTRVLLLALSFRRRFPLLFFISHLYLSVTRLGCSLNALSSIPRVDTPLTADWLKVCLVFDPEKLHTPPLMSLSVNLKGTAHSNVEILSFTLQKSVFLSFHPVKISEHHYISLHKWRKMLSLVLWKTFKNQAWKQFC